MYNLSHEVSLFQDILKINTGDLFPIDSTYVPEAWGSGVNFPTTLNNSPAQFSPQASITDNKTISEESTALVEYKGMRPPRVRIIGNLPFNISTPLLISWLENVANRRQIWRLGRVPMTLTFQKEVCERIVADIWGDQRSRLSVMTQAFCEVGRNMFL